jgi:hypothetical protein
MRAYSGFGLGATTSMRGCGPRSSGKGDYVSGGSGARSPVSTAATPSAKIAGAQHVRDCILEHSAARRSAQVAARRLNDPAFLEELAGTLDRVPKALESENADPSVKRAATSAADAARRVRDYGVRVSGQNAKSGAATLAERAGVLRSIRETHDLLSSPSVIRFASTNPAALAATMAATTQTSEVINAGNNIGPLSEELTQVVLTKGPAIDAITKYENEANWRPFSHAISEGGTGNHDSVIYFENMGWPVLKSSRFNPSKFIEAFGKTYRLAFKAMAQAYGVPVSGESDKAGVSGLDSVSSEFRRKQAEAKSQESRKKLLDALDALVKTYNDKVKGKTVSQADAEAVQKQLNDLSTQLKNPPASKT